MEARREGLIVRSDGRTIEVSNGSLVARFVMRDGGYVQEFRALNAKGEPRLVLSSLHKDLLHSSEHRVGDCPMFSGGRPHLFEACRESLRMVFSEAQVHRPNQDCVMIQLSGSMQGHSLIQRITVEPGSSIVHCEVEAALPGPQPVLEYLMSSYTFLPGGRFFEIGEEPEFTWAPNLRPASDAVIGDLAFFSPAAIVQHGRYAAAIIPDTATLADNRPMPAALDLDLTNGLLFAPLLSYGFCDYELAAGSSYFRHDITLSRRLNVNRLSYAFDLMVEADCKRDFARRQVARYLWNREQRAESRDDEARDVRSSFRTPTSAVPPDACAAYALFAEGLIKNARAMRDALLAAPRVKGIFPTRFDRRTGSWRGCCFPEDSDCYSTVECSDQMYWLLRMHEDFEAHQETLSLAREYADFLAENQLRSGAIPCWHDPDLTPVSALRSGAPTAASGAFLARLARVTGLKKHLQACAAATRFVMREVIPKGRYYDHTCISPEVGVSLECADPHTGMRPQSARAMLWAARLCLEACCLLGDRAYLTSGTDPQNLLCLMQSVGVKPWMTGRGGLLAQGNHRPLADAGLSAEFALCAMEYGASTGTAEYCERASAALRAAAGADCDELSQAKVAAVAAAVQREFGAIYVSLSGKWCVELDGHRVGELGMQGRNVSLTLEPQDSASMNGGRIVFGGLRGRSYKVSINDQFESFSRAQMEAGISIP